MYAFTNCTLLSGEGEIEAIPGMTVITDGPLINAVENGGAYSSKAEIIDLHGAYLMPGLINLHVHLPGSGKPIPVSRMPKQSHDNKPGWIMRSMESGFLRRGLCNRVRKSLLDQLSSGVTTLRSVGEMAWSDLDNRDMIRSGAYTGPRLLVSGNAVGVPDGHMAGTMACICRTPSEASDAVRIAANKGVDWIKIVVTGGVLDASDSGEPARLRMPYEMAAAACETAHSMGLRVASHAESTEGVRVSLRAGVDTVEHGAPMDEEIISLFHERNSSVTLTISPALAIAELPEKLTGMNDAQRACARYALDGMISGATQALKNSITVGLGTDSACPFITQYDMWREVYYYAKYCGVSPGQALFTATALNAEILGLGNVTGRIEPGKAADMIVLKENPLDDLQALRNVEMVIANGTLIKEPKVRHIKTIDDALDKLL